MVTIFCCAIAGLIGILFRKYPQAAKPERSERDFQRALSTCAADPEQGGSISRYTIKDTWSSTTGNTCNPLKDIPYDRWREYDPEDTIRFYSLRLREAGLIKSSQTKSSHRARIGGF